MYRRKMGSLYVSKHMFTCEAQSMAFNSLLNQMADRPQDYVTEQGRVTTNSIEGFHGVALMYRDKRTDLGHTHYICKTNMSIHDFIEILVQTGVGKRTTLLVQPSDTIANIKAKIKEEEGLSPDEQYTLSLDGKLLEDGGTVSSYNMQNGSTLFGASGIAYAIIMIQLYICRYLSVRCLPETTFLDIKR